MTTLTGNHRYHTVQEFNKGVYDYIIATDESGAHEQDEEEEEAEEAPEAADDIMEECRWWRIFYSGTQLTILQ